jgi:Ion channel
VAADDQHGSWRDRVRDPALTAMFIVQCFMIFLAGPFVAAGYLGSRVAMELAGLAFAVLVILASRGPITTTIATLATFLTLAGSVLSYSAPTTLVPILVHIGTVGSFGVVGYVVGSAVFAPGLVTAHRVLGAIVLYLNFGMLGATGYRVLWDFIPGSLSGLPSGAEPWQAVGTIMYFSFVTLTTIGFGDLVPVHPLARGLANLEGVIGQLYPATILARLITLQLEARR